MSTLVFKRILGFEPQYIFHTGNKRDSLEEIRSFCFFLINGSVRVNLHTSTNLIEP